MLNVTAMLFAMFAVIPPAIADLTGLEHLNFFNNHIEVNEININIFTNLRLPQSAKGIFSSVFPKPMFALDLCYAEPNLNVHYYNM